MNEHQLEFQTLLESLKEDKRLERKPASYSGEALFGLRWVACRHGIRFAIAPHYLRFPLDFPPELGSVFGMESSVQPGLAPEREGQSNDRWGGLSQGNAHLKSEPVEPPIDFTMKPSAVVTPSMLAEAIRNGWQVNPERKAKYFGALDKAIDDLPLIEDAAKRASVTAQCTRVLVAEQAAAIKDVQHLESMDQERGIIRLKMERAENNIPNDCVAIAQLPEPTVAPQPAWMKRLGLENVNEG